MFRVIEDKNLRGHTAMFTAQIIFGVNMVVAKMALSSPAVTANSLTFYRMIGAMALMWLTSLFFPREKVARRDMVLLFFASLFGVVFNQNLFIRGLALTSPIDAGILATISPFMTMILAALFLREPITWKKASGVALAMCGAMLLILSSHSLQAREGDFTGNVLCIFSSLSFALYLTLFRDVVRRYRFITGMKWMFTYAAILSLPFSYHSLSPATWQAMSVADLLNVGYVVVFATFISYLLIPIGQQSLRPTVVSIYSNIQPLVAAIVVVAAGMGTFGWDKAGSALLIFAGVYITTISKSRAQIDAQRS